MLADNMLKASNSFRGWQIVNSINRTSVDNPTSAAFPTGYQAGDAVLAFASANTGSTTGWLPVPSGWKEVLVDSLSTAMAKLHVLEQITTQSSYPLVYPDGGIVGVILVVLRPVGFSSASLSTGIIKNAAEASSTIAGNANPPSITTAIDDNLIFAFGLNKVSGKGHTAPSGFTMLRTAGTPMSTALAYAVQKNAGTVDPPAFSGVTDDDWIGMTLALRTRVDPNAVALTGSLGSATADIGGVVQASGIVTVNVEEVATTSISISGGNAAEYRINGGAWTSAAGTVSNGDTVEVRQTSVTGTAGTVTASTATLTIGSATATYTLNTRRELVVEGTTASWTAPSTATVNVVATGAGGAGGAGSQNNTTYRGGGGGGGGAMSRHSFTPVSGRAYSLSAGPYTTQASATGDDSTVTDTVTSTVLCRAKGGVGGTSATLTLAGTGGAGGSATNSVGNVDKRSGGTGGDGVSASASTVLGGGGGGAGGYTGAGGRGANGSTTGSASSGSSGSGGAAAGGGSGSAGGGTGVSGAGANGTGDTGSGNEGSPDAYAGSGLSVNGGASGGGGAGGRTATTSGGNGVGVIRITW